MPIRNMRPNKQNWIVVHRNLVRVFLWSRFLVAWSLWRMPMAIQHFQQTATTMQCLHSESNVREAPNSQNTQRVVQKPEGAVQLQVDWLPSAIKNSARCPRPVAILSLCNQKKMVVMAVLILIGWFLLTKLLPNPRCSILFVWIILFLAEGKCHLFIALVLGFLRVQEDDMAESTGIWSMDPL